MHRQVCEHLPVQTYGTAMWLNQTDNHVKSRRFARPIRSKQTNNFTCPNLNTDVLNNPTSMIHFCSWDLWSEFMDSDGGDEPSRFPTLRVRGSLAIVGVCSALPTLPLLASGALGGEQLERLEKLLSGLTDSGLCRVVLIHHPPTPGAVSRRRALRDAEAFRQVLSRTGAELVLHGHGHRTRFGSIDALRGPIPVVGVRSSSDAGEDPERRAQYHVYEIEPAGSGAGSEFRITTRIRGYDSESGCFTDAGERRL